MLLFESWCSSLDCFTDTYVGSSGQHYVLLALVLDDGRVHIAVAGFWRTPAAQAFDVGHFLLNIVDSYIQRIVEQVVLKPRDCFPAVVLTLAYSTPSDWVRISPLRLAVNTHPVMVRLALHVPHIRYDWS